MVERLNRPAPLPQVVVVPRVSSPEIQRAFDTFSQSLDSVIRLLRPFAQPEAWHVVGNSGEIAFENSFSNYGTSGFQLAAYKKDPLGRIHLRGLLARGSAALSTSIFTLPAGYRPAKNSEFVVMANEKFAHLEVTSGGVVQMIAADSATWYTYFTLDGISFDTES